MGDAHRDAPPSFDHCFFCPAMFDGVSCPGDKRQLNERMEMERVTTAYSADIPGVFPGARSFARGPALATPLTPPALTMVTSALKIRLLANPLEDLKKNVSTNIRPVLPSRWKHIHIGVHYFKTMVMTKVVWRLQQRFSRGKGWKKKRSLAGLPPSPHFSASASLGVYSSPGR